MWHSNFIYISISLSFNQNKQKGHMKFHSLQNIQICLDFLKQNRVFLWNSRFIILMFLLFLQYILDVIVISRIRVSTTTCAVSSAHRHTIHIYIYISQSLINHYFFCCFYCCCYSYQFI